MADTDIDNLVAKNNKEAIVVSCDYERYEKIIKGLEGNTVYDWKQKDFDVRMNDEEPIRVPKAKIIGKGHKHYFNNYDETLKYYPGFRSTIYKMKKWDDGIESYDTDASKKLKDLVRLYNEDNLYCVDRLYLGKVGDTPYMQREYFKRIWKPVNTIPAVGCLVTCIAEVVSYYFDIWKTPSHVDRELDDMDLQANFDWQRGYGKGSANLNTPYVVKNKYGLKYEDKDNKPKDYKDIFRNELDKRVEENKPTIILLKDKKTHFVVVVGIRYKGKDETGIPTDYIINDPGASSSNEKVRYISRDTLRSEYWKRGITKIYLIDKK